MNNISANPLGRTQQAGQGTAFIYDPISNANPIDKLYGYVLNTTKQKAKAKAEKDKLLADKGADLGTEILKINGKLRQQDLPTAQKYQNEIFGWLAEQGGDAFDPMNPAFSELTNKLAQLNSFAGASQLQRQQENIALKEYMDNPNKFDADDFLRFQKNVLSQPTELLVQNMGNPDYYIGVNKKKITPLQYLLESKMGKEIAGKYKQLYTLAKDVKLKDDINKTINDESLVDNFTAKQLLLEGIQKGDFTELTEDEINNTAKQFIEMYTRNAQYEPTTDEKQKFAEKKEANLQAYRNAKLNFEREKFGWAKSQSNPTPFNTIEVFKSAGNGSPNALELIRSGLGDGETFEVIKGEDLIKNNINPDGLNPKAGRNYFKYFTKSGQTIWGDGTNEDVLTKFSNGIIGKNLEAMASANKTSNLGMSGSKQNDIVVGTKTTNSSSSSSSTTKKTVNTKTNKTPIFKMK